MACKKIPVEENKELIKDEDLEKVGGGFSDSETIRIEYGQMNFSGNTQYITALDPQPSASSDSKDNAAKGK